jgi:hypothetical protein
MNCKLSADELESLLPLFNNNGFVDGPEFILLFYRLRHDFRCKLLTERVAKEKKNRLTQKHRQEKLVEDLEQKVYIKLNDSFSEEELRSALSKLLEASVRYDRLTPGAVQLDAFECEFMRPHELREQLKMVFNVQLTVGELSAFVLDFNKEANEGVAVVDRDESVNCAAFLVTFFRMGFVEKEIRVRAFYAKKKKFEQDRDRKKLEAQQELDRKNNLKTSTEFTLEDKERAVAKLRVAAKLYDKSMPGAMTMKAFEVKVMPPHVFREQLKMIFNLQVSATEMGALMSIFDCIYLNLLSFLLLLMILSSNY